MARTIIPTTTDIPNSEIKDHSLIDEAVKLDAEYFNSKVKQAVDELAYSGTSSENGDDIKNTVCMYEQATDRTNIASGEKVGVSMGKVDRYFSDLDKSMLPFKVGPIITTDIEDKSITPSLLGTIAGAVEKTAIVNQSVMITQSNLGYSIKTVAVEDKIPYPNTVSSIVLDNYEIEILSSTRSIAKRTITSPTTLNLKQDYQIAIQKTPYRGMVSFSYNEEGVTVAVNNVGVRGSTIKFSCVIQSIYGKVENSATANGLKISLVQNATDNTLGVTLEKDGDFNATQISTVSGTAATNEVNFIVKATSGKTYRIKFVKK